MQVLIPKTKSTSEADVNAIEAQISASLPDDYRTFLRTSDGCMLQPNEFRKASYNIGAGVHEFILASALPKLLEHKKHSALKGYLPFAYDDYGNIFAMAPQNSWIIVFWDHETDQVVQICKNFSEFLSSLHPLDHSALPDPDLISTWIDPAFKPEFE